MPTSQLSALSEQIEKQDTDHFGKFYMYVSLLNTVAVRKKNFAQSLPQYSSGLAFWRDKQFTIGTLPVSFTENVTQYASQYNNKGEPGWSKIPFNIVLTYFRKGKITDLMFIIDKMLAHLTTMDDPKSKNHGVREYINFDKKKEVLAEFINEVSACNKQLLAVVDNGCNTALSGMAVVIGLTIILASVFSLVPSLIGLGLIVAGACAAVYFYDQLQEPLNSVGPQLLELQKKAQNLPQDKSIFGDKNYQSFFSSVVTPLPYAAITAAEQIVPDETEKQKLIDARQSLDQIFAMS
jgi:hypothetical protein